MGPLGAAVWSAFSALWRAVSAAYRNGAPHIEQIQYNAIM